MAGIVALGLGLGVAELVAGLLGRTSTPVVAVGEAFIDMVPGWLKDLAIDLFGTNDKVALVVGTLIVLAALSAAIGILATQSLAAGLTAATGLLVIAGIAVWTRPDRETTDLVPTVVGGLAALGALAWLTRRALTQYTAYRTAIADERESAVQASSDPARRSFLTSAAVVAGFAIATGGIGRWLGGRRAEVEASRDTLADSVPLPSPTIPDGVDLGIDGGQPWQTGNRDFYLIDTALAEPLISADSWQLHIHGMVEREVRLSYRELIDMGLEDHWITLSCVSNQVGGDLIGNALWTGVPIADVLALAQPTAGADAVKSTSDDGWTAGTPLDVLTDQNRSALLAVGMNGEPLPVEHGFPVRMIVPGLYGYVSATKWVVEMEVTRFGDFDAYWTTRGWSELGPVKVSSRIDVPSSGNAVDAGTVVVAGSAWAQHRGVAAVQIRVDEGEWQPTTLAQTPNADSWRQWVWEWDAEPGEHRLEVRATTDDGELQTGVPAPVTPDGATGWHGIDVSVE